MSNQTTQSSTPVHSVTKRTGRAIGEAIDGHTDFMVGWTAARHPQAVEARQSRHVAAIDAYLSEMLAEYNKA